MAIIDATDFSPGDVVVVPFPYTDRFAEKRRPALVVSNARLAARGYVWVVMITSAKHESLEHDMKLRNSAAAGLSAPSIARPVKIACIEPGRIVRKPGRLGEAEIDGVLASVRSFLEDEPARRPHPSHGRRASLRLARRQCHGPLTIVHRQEENIWRQRSALSPPASDPKMSVFQKS